MKFSDPTPRLLLRSFRQSSARRGLTLVEIMIAMALFTIMAGGIMGTHTMAMRVAHANIHRNTAISIGQGYLEQIKSIPFETVEMALTDPANHPLPTRGISSARMTDQESQILDDFLVVGQSNYKRVLLDVDAAGEETHMELWVTPRISQSFRLAADGITHIPDPSLLEVELELEWRSVNRNRVSPDPDVRTVLRTTKIKVFEN